LVMASSPSLWVRVRSRQSKAEKSATRAHINAPAPQIQKELRIDTKLNILRNSVAWLDAQLLHGYGEKEKFIVLQLLCEIALLLRRSRRRRR
jgi:hypothetical protein